jgi:hypothetical protein
MKRFLIPLSATAAIVVSTLSCHMHPAYLKFASEIEPDVWDALQDSGCDITSDEAEQYVDCVWGVWDEERQEYQSHLDECKDEYAKVPGCAAGAPGPAGLLIGPLLPSSGTMIYACDVSIEEEGTYNDEYCPKGHSIELTISIDWAEREFTYQRSSSCSMEIMDWWEDYIETVTGTTQGGGTLIEGDWLLGEYAETVTRSFVCGPPRYCGVDGLPPEAQTTEYRFHIVGRVASWNHVEMGFQDQQYPLDSETLQGFSSWADLESAGRGSKSYDCIAIEPSQ